MKLGLQNFSSISASRWQVDNTLLTSTGELRKNLLENAYLQSFENGYVRNDALRRLLSKAVNTPGFIADVQLPTSVPEPVIKRSDSGFEVQTESVSVQKSSDGNLSAPNFEPADSIQAPSQGDSLSPVQSEPAGETDQAPSEPRSEPVPLNQPSDRKGGDGFSDAFVDMLG